MYVCVDIYTHAHIHMCGYVHVCVSILYKNIYIYIFSAGLIHCCRPASLSVILLSPTPTTLLLPHLHISRILLEVTQLPAFLSPHNPFSFPTPQTSLEMFWLSFLYSKSIFCIRDEKEREEGPERPRGCLWAEIRRKLAHHSFAVRGEERGLSLTFLSSQNIHLMVHSCLM